MFLRNAVIATGALVFVYVMLKLFKSDTKKDSNTDVSEKAKKEETIEKSSESTQPVVKVVNNIKPMKNFKPKPNFFLAFKVNDVGIHKKVKELQEKLIAKNPALFPALINVSTLHITLGVTHLANETHIKTLKTNLDEWAEKNVKIFFKDPCVVSFSGVKTFNNTVAYVDMDQCSSYKKVVEISNSFRDLLSSSGFITDKKSVVPHLTFLKLSKDIRLLKLKKIFRNDFESLKKFEEHFGKQEITSIQLLSMNDPKDETGFYKCYHNIKISDSQQDSDHSECCSPVAQPKSLAKKEFKNIFHNLKGKK